MHNNKTEYKIEYRWEWQAENVPNVDRHDYWI